MPESNQTYHPEITPNRGEFNAWALALVALAAGIFLATRAMVPGWAVLFVAVLFFSALSISLGNWVERRTCLVLAPEAVLFENGLRRVRLDWADIHEVRVLPSRWGGQTVHVIGADAHFTFNTLGEVNFRGQLRGRTGFANGQSILAEILQCAGLTRQAHTEHITTYLRP